MADTAAKPQPATVTDPDQVDATYRYWRARTLYSCFIGYAIFYFCRRNIPLALPRMAAELQVSKAQLGAIESAGHLFYGVGKFANGVLADRTNARHFMALGLVLTAITNMAFGSSTSLTALVAIWALNGWFQSMGFPPGARLLSHWYSPSEYGRIWGIWGCSHQVGTAAVSVAASYLVAFGWRQVFFVPAAVALIMAGFLYHRLRDIPSTMGLPPVEQYKNEVHDATALASLERPVSVREALFGHVLNNPLLWSVACGNFFLYVARYGVNTWLPALLKEARGLAIVSAGWLSACFEIGGIAGMLSAGWISDRLMGARRGPVMAAYMFALSFAMLGFWKARTTATQAAALALCGFLIYGPLMLVSVAAAGFAGKKLAATAAGFTGFWGYMGATVSGVGVGRIVDVFGWRAGFLALVASCVLSAACFGIAWTARPAAYDR